MGKPKELEHYELHHSNGIHVYVRPNIPTREGKLTIFLSQFLFMKALLVDGVTNVF